MNIRIFGASGGIGKWAVKHALSKGYHINAYVRNPQKLDVVDENLTVIKGEISDYTKVKEAVNGKDGMSTLN